MRIQAMTAADVETFRNALGLSQTELAERIGVTPQAVCQWESGKRKPSRLALILLGQLRDELRNSVKKTAKSH